MSENENTEEINAAIKSVADCLKSADSECEVERTEKTIFTVTDAAEAVGVSDGEIVKSILLRVNRGAYYALALLSGSNLLDSKKAKKALGASRIAFAGADECFEYSGFRPGGVSPVGYEEQPPTLIDEDLFKYEKVWSAAGSDRTVFASSPQELARLTGGKKTDLKKIKKPAES
jgi:prolyl-tRNA editing enzyme YbaK/EbsC (Cys-tRNA(Pro) deacylase)